MSKSIGRRTDGTLRFPKAAVGRRVASGALDYIVLIILIAVVNVLAPFTVYLLDFLAMPLVAAYWACRDLGGGRYAPGKLIGGFQVLDVTTGDVVGWKQALARNSYFVVLILLSAIPVVEWANMGLVALVMVVDVIVMLANPDGRRLGDMIAGTQVVPVDKPSV